MHTEAVLDEADGHLIKLAGSCQDVSLITSYAENLQTAQVYFIILVRCFCGLVYANI